MSNKNLAQEFLEAVKIIASDSVSSANEDQTQTVLMQVTKVPTETNNTYEVKYQSQAYSNVLSASSWEKDDFVYVICPGGIDSTTQKTIISGLPKHKEIKEAIQTFEDVYQIIGAQARTNSVDFYPEEEAIWYDENKNSFDLDKESLLAYLRRGNGLVISADFLTAFSDAFFQHENSEKCNFGIEVVLKEKKTVNNKEKEETVSYLLDVNNMEGYPYLFTTATKQTEYFIIEHPENILDLVSIKGFFKNYPIESTESNLIKVTMSNFSFSAFYDKKEVEKNELIIFTKNNLQSIENVLDYSTTQITLETIFFNEQSFKKEPIFNWYRKQEKDYISMEGSRQCELIGAMLLSEKNIFKCEAIADQKIVGSSEITIVNKNPFKISSSLDTAENPYSITVTVEPNDENLEYQWIKIDNNEEQVKMQEAVNKIEVDATSIPIKNSYKCSVFFNKDNKKYWIGSTMQSITQLIETSKQISLYLASNTTSGIKAPTFENLNDIEGQEQQEKWTLDIPTYDENSPYLFMTQQVSVNNMFDPNGWSEPVIIREKNQQVSTDRSLFLTLTSNASELGVFEGKDIDGKEVLAINATYIQTGNLLVKKDNEVLLSAKLDNDEASVEIGGFTVQGLTPTKPGAIYTGSEESNNFIYLGTDKIKVGNGFEATADGNVVLQGSITAGSSITGSDITGSSFKIENENITAGILNDEDETKPSLNSEQGIESPIIFYSGKKNEDYTFYVLLDGSLYATAAKFSGKNVIIDGDVIFGKKTVQETQKSIENAENSANRAVNTANSAKKWADLTYYNCVSQATVQSMIIDAIGGNMPPTDSAGTIEINEEGKKYNITIKYLSFYGRLMLDELGIEEQYNNEKNNLDKIDFPINIDAGLSEITQVRIISNTKTSLVFTMNDEDFQSDDNYVINIWNKPIDVNGPNIGVVRCYEIKADGEREELLSINSAWITTLEISTII